MERTLVTLLLAIGVSCAPPLIEISPVTISSPPILATTTTTATSLQPELLAEPTELLPTTQKSISTTTTVEAMEGMTVKANKTVGEELDTEDDVEDNTTYAEQSFGIPVEITSVTSVITEQPAITTIAEEIITTTKAASTTPQPTRHPRLSGKERESIMSYLGNVDLTNIDNLVTTPTQEVAIAQELEYQELGLAPFTDPTPWQRLTREQQTEFNEKYLTLRSDLQDYSRNQFLSLPEDRQAHAYGAFLFTRS